MLDLLSEFESSRRAFSYRHTKIIATLGPATEDKTQLQAMIRSGVDIMRLNMAHASHDWVADVIRHIREASSLIGREVAIMMDVKGPEVRTGVLDQPILLQPGNTVTFYTAEHEAVEDGTIQVPVNYGGLPADVEIGAEMLVDSGLIRLRVIDKDRTSIRAEVRVGGNLGSRRHINLPGVHVRLPALTKKDKHDLEAGVAAGIDFVALSFVREAEDVCTLRRFLDSLGSHAKIIAKLEDQAGLHNSEGIVAQADGIMVARGDLGIEIEFQLLPLVQSKLVQLCQKHGKPVIIATQLLESMMNSPMPTRAEISDVSTAIRERADCVMLSGETAAGKYPLECIQVLKTIIRSVEPSVEEPLNTTLTLSEPKAKMLRSAALLAQDLGQSGIVVFTRSGFLAYTLGALRASDVPIYAFTDVDAIYRQLLLPWGVEPFRLVFSADPEETIRNALRMLKEKNWCPQGTWLVVITNALASDQIIDTLQLRQID